MADAHDCRSKAEPVRVIAEVGWLEVLCLLKCMTCSAEFGGTINGWSASAIQRRLDTVGGV